MAVKLREKIFSHSKWNEWQRFRDNEAPRTQLSYLLLGCLQPFLCVLRAALPMYIFFIFFCLPQLLLLLLLPPPPPPLPPMFISRRSKPSLNSKPQTDSESSKSCLGRQIGGGYLRWPWQKNREKQLWGPTDFSRTFSSVDVRGRVEILRVDLEMSRCCSLDFHWPLKTSQPPKPKKIAMKNCRISLSTIAKRIGGRKRHGSTFYAFSLHRRKEKNTEKNLTILM